MFSKYKKHFFIVLALSLGVLLIILGKNIKENDTVQTTVTEELYTEKMEAKIESFLKEVSGIRNCKVILTLEKSSETVYAQNGNLDYLILSDNDGDRALSVTEIYPTVKGVAIACTNGDDDEIKLKISQLISCYLGIPSNRIQIVSLK